MKKQTITITDETGLLPLKKAMEANEEIAAGEYKYSCHKLYKQKYEGWELLGEYKNNMLLLAVNRFFSPIEQLLLKTMVNPTRENFSDEQWVAEANELNGRINYDEE